ncbi:hypothetical protein LTR36_002398 [Oleoguttula mirabilis]|uniref:Uncharacterized protein n=1 Tax=Oleoguttula mirabilis TaxID=1507867 RepID=A0AAV9JK62_9PEZI|nr:hypothetical protein LTR36_002398 [Oleoguttula mirabilis]
MNTLAENLQTLELAAERTRLQYERRCVNHNTDPREAARSDAQMEYNKAKDQLYSLHREGRAISSQVNLMVYDERPRYCKLMLPHMDRKLRVCDDVLLAKLRVVVLTVTAPRGQRVSFWQRVVSVVTLVGAWVKVGVDKGVELAMRVLVRALRASHARIEARKE